MRQQGSGQKRQLLLKLQSTTQSDAVRLAGARNALLVSKSLTTLPAIRPKTYNAEEVLENISNKYSNDDKDMFNALINYCYDLQNQVTDLKKSTQEMQLQALQAASKSAAARSREEEVAQYGAHGGYDGSKDTNLSAVVEKIETKLGQIRQLFSNSDPLHQRFKAAAKIQSLVRCRIVWKKYVQYQRSVEVWRGLKCQIAIELCMAMVHKIEQTQHALAMFKLKNYSKTIYKFFRVWKAITSVSAPRRREALKVVEIKAREKSRELLVKVFAFMKLTCLVKARRQRIIVERRHLRDTLRLQISEQLKARGESGMVPVEMVDKAMNVRITEDYISRKNGEVKQRIFDIFVDLVRSKRKKEKIANSHKFKVTVGRIFYAWSDWVYLVGIGLDRKRWRAARIYEVRYNQKKVDYFARKRLLKMVLRPWRNYAIRSVRANNMFRKQMAAFMKNILLAWRAISVKFRRLRIETIESWRGYARLVLQSPFQQWAQYAIVSQKKSFESEHRATLFARWKQRKYMMRIIRTWRHYALYGRVDGMYTRPVLLQTLREQKMQCARMVKVMASQTVQIESMTASLESEIQRRKRLEKNLRVSDEENRRGRMAVHHMQSEIQRLETVIESMAVINRNQIHHLMENQIAFGFKDRSKAYGIDGTFDPFLSSVGAELVDEPDNADEEGETSMNEKDLEKASLGASSSMGPNFGHTVAKKSVATTTRDMFEAGDLSDLISQKDKEQLHRVGWLLDRFFAPPTEKDEVGMIYALEERPPEGENSPPISYSVLSQNVPPEYKAYVELLKNMILFLKDGCTSGLNIRDRRHWTKELLSKVKADAPEELTEALEATGIIPQSDAKGESDPLHLDALTWRTSLSALHSMSATSLTHESTIFNRVIDMRENIKTITNRHSGKYERRQIREDNIANGFAPNDGVNLADEPNVYALNMKGMLGIGDEEFDGKIRQKETSQSEEDEEDMNDADDDEED